MARILICLVSIFLLRFAIAQHGAGPRGYMRSDTALPHNIIKIKQNEKRKTA